MAILVETPPPPVVEIYVPAQKSKCQILAEDALGYVQSLKIESQNYVCRYEILEGAALKKKQKEVKKKAVYVQEATTSLLMDAAVKQGIGYYNPFTLALHSGSLSEKHRHGNCQEMTNVAFRYLAQQEDCPKLDVMLLKNHAFLVVGRDIESSASDYTTWGQDAFICDPWKGALFPAGDSLTELHDLDSYDKTTGLPKLTPFDPKTNPLQLGVGYILTAKDLQEMPSPTIREHQIVSSKHELAYQDVGNLLDEFHADNSQESRESVIKQLREKCEDATIKHDHVIHTLETELEYFQGLLEI